jgi:hypothetical protein
LSIFSTPQVAFRVLKTKVFFYTEKTLYPTTYNAGVVAVNSKVVGLAHGLGIMI